MQYLPTPHVDSFLDNESVNMCELDNELISLLNGLSWVTTDPATNQQGRQISDNVFEFSEDGKDSAVIEVENYFTEEIEDVISSYGYTLFNERPHFANIKNAYPNNWQWIIAECIYESLF